MEQISSDGRLRELHQAGRGFILNDFGGPMGPKSFNMLHRASCDYCDPDKAHRYAMKTKTSGEKIHFVTFKEAAVWLLENRPSMYERCAACDPR